MKYKLLVFTFIIFSYFSYSQDSQNTEISKIKSGSFAVYKQLEVGYNKYKLELAKKAWPVEFFTEGGITSKILVKRVGIIEEYYTADLPKYPAYYLSKTNNVNVSVIDEKIYYYTWSSKYGATIKYILSQKKPSSYTSEKEVLDKYRKSIKPKQTGSRNERIAEKKAEQAKIEAENTLKGKSIKSIKLKAIDVPAEIGMLTVVSIGAEITLTNGKVLKTKNLGGLTPYKDFAVKAKGGDYAGGDFKVSDDSRKIPTDKIELELSSKFSTSSPKGKIAIPINYKNDLFYDYRGYFGGHGRQGVAGKSIHGGHGTNGQNVRVTTKKMLINGENITKVVIKDADTGNLLSEAKVHLNNMVTLDVSGGGGGSGDDNDYDGGAGGNGGDGGDGGNVYLSGDGIYQLRLNIKNAGGNGGAGGVGKTRFDPRGYPGKRGKSGSIIK